VAIKRGDLVLGACDPSGLVDNLITQPLIDPGAGTLDTDTSTTGKLIRASGTPSPVSDFHVCNGIEIGDLTYTPLQQGRILRSYLSRSTSTCNAPITFNPSLGLDSSGYFDNNNPQLNIVTFGPQTYGFFSTHDDWTLPEFAGEQWRITSQDWPFTSPGSIWLSGTIDGTGFPTGLTLNHLGPGVFLLEFQGLGIISSVPNPDYPTGGPIGPTNIQYRYKLFYSCSGNWLHVAGITPW
jgi:hypothetical protein